MDDEYFLEMPFGPPPILPDIKTELKEYIVHMEKLPIHQLDKVQQYWKREANIMSLLHADLTPIGTTLKYERDPTIGCIGDVQEVCIQNIGQTVRNSMSMTRAPGPTEEVVRGNANNFLFWPGGFDEPEKSKDTNIEIDFENNLKTYTKGFKTGIEFMSDNCTPKLSSNKSLSSNKEAISNNKDSQILIEDINITSVINQESQHFKFWSNDKTHEENKENNNDTQNANVEVPNIDEFIEPLKKINIPILKISEVPRYNLKTEWAEQIDIMVPVTDFDEKIPDPAMSFPYELDNFQKQAILKLEEKCNVFVAAHTSAGKTTIAEYAIAMSEKHMTRTIYTSPIKALSNQKFREFREKFKDVGLITGDVQINPTGTCLIMTTEILQSMLYCAADVIRDVEFVVFDEVHYINNEDRGHVWEEAIILLPATVNIVMLSATVPNPVEFAHWIGQIKRRKMYVISTIKRPVPLEHYIYTGYDKKTKDQIYLLVNKNNEFLKDSLIKAESANKEALENQKKLQKTKHHYASHKPYPVYTPIGVPKNASAEEAVNAVMKAKGEEEAAEDKLKANMITVKEKRMWLALLEYLLDKDKLPVVIFALSRNKLDKIVNAFSESILSRKEIQYVEEFFAKSIKHLKGSDSQLPQVLKMQKLLKLGIGIHHSGILPILKEIVEMLFQKGIVKVLFATETFAMGVNMPAKTVVFDSIRKYDGGAFRNLLPTEYIQMAGRAGRRGHDDIGTVIILCRQKIPSEQDIKVILRAPQNLESKFKVTYPMVLHLKRLSEAISIGDMMRRSFKEVRTLSNQEKNKNELEKIKQLIDQTQPLAEHQKELELFYDLAIKYLQIWKKLRSHMLQTKKAIKSLIEGRILVISYQHHFNKLGIFLGIQKKSSNLELYKVFILTSKEDLAKIDDKSEIWYDIMSLIKTKFYKPISDQNYDVLLIPAANIIEITNSFVTIESKFILADWEKRQIPRFKDAPYNNSCETAIEKLVEISNKVQKNMTVILPFVELKPTNFEQQEKFIEFQNITKQIEALKKTILKEANFEDEFEQVFKHKELQQKRQDLVKKLSDEYLSNYSEYEDRLEILKTLNYINHDDRITLKGRVALEMGTHEIFLTELVLDNVLTNWEPEEIAAMLSSLVFAGRKNEEDEKEKLPRLKELQNEMMKVFEKIVTIEQNYQLDPILQPSFALVRVVYEWAHGKSFSKIMEFTNIQEGIIVKCIQKLNETLQDVKNAAIIIGHPALREKMEEASTKIKRDIVFTASLYTQD